MTAHEFTQIRKQLGMNQREIADELGVHYNTVNNWEADRHRIPNATAVLLRHLAAKT